VGIFIEMHALIKSAAIGGFLAGIVLSNALANTGGSSRSGPVSAQQLRSNLQTRTKLAMNLSSEIQTMATKMANQQATKSIAQIAQEGPIYKVVAQLVPALMKTPNLNISLSSSEKPAGENDFQLSFIQNAWLLDYSMTSSDYTLIYQLDATVLQKSAKTIFFKESCSDSSRKMTLEDWQKDDSAAIAKAAQEIAQACAQNLLTKLDIKPYTPAAPNAESLSTATAPADLSTPTTPGGTADASAPIASSEIAEKTEPAQLIPTQK
jgi:hypothetical protein